MLFVYCKAEPEEETTERNGRKAVKRLMIMNASASI
jgi:hypothetical protein